jgi:hypothetical protein
MQAPPDQVKAFNQDGSSPPTVEKAAINWTSSLKTSPWNQEMVRLLAADFHVRIKMGRYPTVIYDADCMNIKALRHICMQKLSRTHDACRQQVGVDSQPIE